jgi:hypothetical protein
MFGADSDEGLVEARDRGYEDGFSDGAVAGLKEIPARPASIFNHLKPCQFQSAFDEIKAEAIRLGVKP